MCFFASKMRTWLASSISCCMCIMRCVCIMKASSLGRCAIRLCRSARFLRCSACTYLNICVGSTSVNGRMVDISFSGCINLRSLLSWSLVLLIGSMVAGSSDWGFAAT